MTNRNRPNTIPLEEIPKKIYYSISEASEFTGVEPHVLRYWETKFSKLNPKRVGGNQRKYTRGDIELLYEIVNLLYSEGYTLDGAERKLKGGLQALRAERELEQEREKDKDKLNLTEIVQSLSQLKFETDPETEIQEEIPIPTLFDIKSDLLEVLKILNSY